MSVYLVLLLSIIFCSTIYCQNQGIGFWIQKEKYESDNLKILHPNPRNGYFLSANNLTWSEGLKHCDSSNGYLAVINSQEEAQLLSQVIMQSNYSDYFHIGFHDMYEEGLFFTIQGQTLEDAGYDNWQKGEPSGGKKENCGSLHFSGTLNDIACDRYTGPYICEYD